MRRLGAGLAATAALGLALGGYAGAQGELVRLKVRAPDSVPAKTRFAVTVRVAANAGALDIAAKPLRLRARMAPRCGATIGTSKGPTVIDRKLSPPPRAKTRYRFAASGRVRIRRPGRRTVCAFLVDADQRQFATSVDTVVRVRKR